MSREDRAKQFAPFSVLKGYDEALREKEKIIVEKVEYSEEYAEELNRKFQEIQKNDMVTVIYYRNQEYIQKTGMVARIDITARMLKVVNEKISFDDIFDIEKEKGLL